MGQVTSWCETRTGFLIKTVLHTRFFTWSRKSPRVVCYWCNFIDIAALLESFCYKPCNLPQQAALIPQGTMTNSSLNVQPGLRGKNRRPQVDQRESDLCPHVILRKITVNTAEGEPQWCWQHGKDAQRNPKTLEVKQFSLPEE